MKMNKLFAGLLGLALFVTVAHAATNSVSVERMSSSGLAATYTSSGLSSADTYQFGNDGRVFLHVKKSGAGACTVTVATPATVQGFAIAELTVSIPASTGDKFIGPFSPSIFNDASGNVSFTVSDTAGLSFAIVKLP